MILPFIVFTLALPLVGVKLFSLATLATLASGPA
jgi:hypothetical protein